MTWHHLIYWDRLAYLLSTQVSHMLVLSSEKLIVTLLAHIINEQGFKRKLSECSQHAGTHYAHRGLQENVLLI